VYKGQFQRDGENILYLAWLALPWVALSCLASQAKTHKKTKEEKKTMAKNRDK
jgi:hypothetical protein